MGRARRNKKKVRQDEAAARRRKGVGIVGGFVVAGLLAVALMARYAAPAQGHHPDVRPVTEQPDVVPAARYAEYPRVARSYEMAAAIPHVLDGIYCHCDCSQHSGHHSLLDCFRDDHAARCDVCMSEAVIAYEMTQEGADLDEIRAAVDETYGT